MFGCAAALACVVAACGNDPVAEGPVDELGQVVVSGQELTVGLDVDGDICLEGADLPPSMCIGMPGASGPELRLDSAGIGNVLLAAWDDDAASIDAQRYGLTVVDVLGASVGVGRTGRDSACLTFAGSEGEVGVFVDLTRPSSQPEVPPSCAP